MTHEQLVERLGIALAVAAGASENHARKTLWMEPLAGGLLVRRDIREDRGEQPGANWVKMPIWEFHHGATARAALAIVYEAMRVPTPRMRDVLFDGSRAHRHPVDVHADWLAASPLNPEVK